MDLKSKPHIEASLLEENRMINEGKLKEDNPLDLSEPFKKLCEACRRGDLKGCQETITEGVNINARDRFDYTPLILASLCGHYEVVQLLLESGALCERDTFQGERCLYNALNDRIRNLLLSYDYSKTSDPLQPFAAHVTSLLFRDIPQTSDIVVTSAGESFRLHKFILSSRSPYFFRKLAAAPDCLSWKLPATIPPQAFDIAIKYLYFGEIPNDLGGGPGTGFTEDEILEGIDKITKQLEIRNLWDGIIEAGDKRLARQRRTDEVERGRAQLEAWYRDNVLKYKTIMDANKARDVKWDRHNGVFADVILLADEEMGAEDNHELADGRRNGNGSNDPSDADGGIPIGPFGLTARSPSRKQKSRKATIFPVHRAMLLRAEYFALMFSSGFKESQDTEYLQIIPIDCSPEVLEIVLTFLYTEKTDFPLEHAVEVLFAADLLLIDKLKMKAAVIISTLGNGQIAHIPSRLDTGSFDPQRSGEADLDIYEVIRAGWLTRVERLEDFGARYIAYRLEHYIDEQDFAELVKESASRIKNRQETDSIVLLDEIRHYLSERFRLRFEDVGMEEMMDEEGSHKDSRKELPGDSLPDTPSAPNAVAFADTQASVGTEQISRTVHTQSGKMNGTIRTLDGDIAGDEMEMDAINYQILLGKIDGLLDTLRLDA